MNETLYLDIYKYSFYQKYLDTAICIMEMFYMRLCVNQKVYN